MKGMGAKAKLTLWIDRETVRFGKELARENRDSLSGMVSAYLARLKAAGQSPSLTPMVRKLSGVLKGKRGDRASYRKHLEKKYLG